MCDGNGFYDAARCQAYVIIRFRGKTVIPEEITAQLGIVPMHVYHIGDAYQYIKGFTKYAEWSFRTAEREICDTAEVFEDFMTVLKDKTDVINEIKRKYADCESSVYIVVSNRQALLPSFTTPAEQVAFLASIGEGLYHDVYHTAVRYDEDGNEIGDEDGDSILQSK